MSLKKRASVRVSGRVQGVFFRMETKRFADAAGVTGWVKNMPDGTVAAVFEGDEPLVEKAVQWCRRGPSLARVEDLNATYEGYTGQYNTFDIVH